jgi:hypothetical protein
MKQFSRVILSKLTYFLLTMLSCEWNWQQTLLRPANRGQIEGKPVKLLLIVITRTVPFVIYFMDCIFSHLFW